MPNYRQRYPDNWSEIATAIKETSGWRCARCGWQCIKPGEKTPHLSRSERMAHTLQVHHWNRNPEDNRFENLVALCTSCHLAYHQGGSIKCVAGAVVFVVKRTRTVLPVKPAYKNKYLGVTQQLPGSGDRLSYCLNLLIGKIVHIANERYKPLQQFPDFPLTARKTNYRYTPDKVKVPQSVTVTGAVSCSTSTHLTTFRIYSLTSRNI